MSKESKTANFLTGDFISEDAVRGVLGRRRRTPPATATDAGDAVPANSRDQAPSPARRTAPLRRWSVAELVARAFAAPPADGMSR